MTTFLKWIAMGIAFAIGFILAATFTVPVLAIGIVVLCTWGMFKLVTLLFGQL